MKSRFSSSVIYRLRTFRSIVAVFQSVQWLLRFVLGVSSSASVPAWYKRWSLKVLIRKHDIDWFIETGTYLGQTSIFIAHKFPRLSIDSCEIDIDLYERATALFRKSQGRVSVHFGDSKNLLNRIILLNRGNRVLFWLDGHFSDGITGKGDEESPLAKELALIGNCIRGKKKVVIAIDDVNELNFNRKYPDWQFIHNFAMKNNLNIEIKGSLAILS